jgi:iron complex outermembrane recepter protein
MVFTLDLEQETDGRWIVDVPELPGVMAYGDTQDEAVAQPNFGAGYTLFPAGINSRSFTCTSGLPMLTPWILDTKGRVQYLDDFELTDDCLDMITAPMTQRNVVTQQIAEANFQGRLADMPAGELRSAFGVSMRTNDSLFEPDALFNAVTPAMGQTKVAEIYGEVLNVTNRQNAPRHFA